MRSSRSNITEKAISKNKTKHFTKTRLTLIASFIVIALMSTAAFSSTSAAGSLSNLLSGSASLLNFLDSNSATVQSNNSTQSKSFLDQEPTSPNVARNGHTATDLGDGKVLLVGGDANGTSSILDVKTGTFTATANLSVPRVNHTATKLADGRVLVAGGDSGNGAGLNSTEIFNPANGSFTAGPVLTTGRTGQTATTLPNGRILIVGGDVAGSAEILDINEGSVAVNTQMSSARSMHSAALMQDGRVLILGGKDAAGKELESAEIFDGSGFISTGNALAHHRVKPLLRVLHDGKVQIIGGNNDESMEVYDPADNIFGAHGHVIPLEDEHAALLKSDILSAPTRAALIHGGSSDVQLKYSNHAITEISGRNEALLTGGANHSGTLNTLIFNSSNATVSTDKLDYQPGQTARISGTGWLAGEKVNIIIHEDPHTHTERRLTATADESGNFAANYLVEQHDLDVEFIIGAKGASSGRTAQTTFTDTSNQIRDIRFNTVSQPTDFTAGASNVASSPLRVQAINASNNGETVTGGDSITVQVTTNSATGKFDTSTAGSFTSNSITLTIPSGNQNTPDFFYKDTTAGSVTFTATVTAVTGNVPSSVNGKVATLAKSVTAAAASRLAFSTQPSNTNAGTAISPAVTVRIEDQFGNLTTSTRNVSLAIGINPGSGTLGGTTSVAAVNGIATFSNLSINNAGTGYTLTASSASPAPALTTATSNAFNIISTNAAPSINRDNAAVTVNEGSIANNTGTWSDTNAGDTVTLSASIGTVTKNGTNAGGTWSWSYTPTDNAPTQTVTITANDGTTTSQTTFDLTVNNVAPTATFNASGSVDQNGSLAISLTSPSDPSSADTTTGFTYAFDCGDGAGYGAFGSSSSANCSTTTTGTRTVKGKIKDKDNGETEYTKSVVVRSLTSVTLVSGSGTYGGNATLTAKLTSGNTNLSGKSVSFTYNGNPVETVATDANGVATATLSLSGINAGNYANAIGASFAGDTDYAGSNGSGALEVSKAAATISLSNLTGHIYDGSAKSATATTDPSGLSAVSITYDGSATAPTNAGSYAVVASLTNDNYQATDATGTLVIAKADQVISWTAPAGIVYGTALSATQLNASLTTGDGALTYSPAAGAVLNAGNGQTLRVDAAETTNYNAAFATVTIDVAKADQVIAWNNPTAITYGTALGNDQLNASLTTGDGALTYSPAAGTILSAGSQTLRVDAAETTNYKPAFKEVSLVVNRAAASISLGNLEHTYDGSAKNATATTSPEGLSGVAITYDASATAPTNAGSYAVVASLTNDNYEAPNANGTLVISRATATVVLGGLSHTYDGSTKAATATTTPEGLNVTFAYSQGGNPATPVNAGNYDVTATVNDNNYQGGAGGVLNIAKASATISLSNLTGHTYDGSAKSATATTDPPGLESVAVTYDGSATAPTNAGSYAVVASLSNANYEAQNATGTLVINKASASISLGNLTGHTYDGSAKSATALTDPAGLTGVSISYSQNDQAVLSPTDAGSYAVVASLDNANYQADNATGTLVIDKAAATVELGSLSHTYNGDTKAATATTNPAGLNVTFAYSQSGNPATPVNAGNYDVTATVNDNNYQGGASGVLNIAKAAATISLSDLIHTYNGSAKSATATTDPAGLTGVSITYDGSATSPTSAGSYAVVASLSNANYEAQNATGSLVIGKAAATISLGNLTGHIYDGLAKNASATTDPAGLSGVSITYDGSDSAPTNAGSYSVVASLDNTNYQAQNATGTLVIDKAAATVELGSLSHTYNGDTKAATATTNPAGLNVTFAYSQSGNPATPVNAGNYDVTATISDDNYQGSNNGVLNIAKATPVITWINPADISYGTALSGMQLNASTNVAGGFVYTPAAGTVLNAGNGQTLSVEFTPTDTTNYNGNSANVAINVMPATPSITVTGGTFSFDGNSRAATASATGVGNVTVNGSFSFTYTPPGNSTEPVNAGTYGVSANFTSSDTNYSNAVGNGSITIEQAGSTTTVTVSNATFDGNPHGGTATVTGTGGLNQSLTVSYSGRNGTVYPASTTPPTNAGDYTASATFNGDTNYAGSSDSQNFSISKAGSTTTVTVANATYGGNPHGGTASVTGDGGLNQSLTVNYEGRNGTTYGPTTTAPTNAGDYTASASFAGDDNHTGSSDSKDFSIGKAVATVSITGGTFTYNGNPHPATGSVTGVNSENLGTPTFEYTPGGSNAPVNFGTYSVVGSFAGNNNYNSANSEAAQIVINRANQTINFAALLDKFHGNGGIVVSATGGGSGNPVTFSTSTPSVCTNGGTNGATISFVGLGTCTVTASQAGNDNYNAASSVERSFQVKADTTSVVLDMSGHSMTVYDCVKNVIAATVTNTVTNQPVSGVLVALSIGNQTITATTNSQGKASGVINLNQTIGSVQVLAGFAGGGFLAGSSHSQNMTIQANSHVGPGEEADSLYTGSSFFWTTSSTSSSATLTLSATLRDVSSCQGDITKAKASFLISTNGGTSFSPISNAQNLPVGLVNPNDPNTGTASAISQYNLGNSSSATVMIRVVVSGQYIFNTQAYDTQVTITKAGLANSLTGGGKLRNNGTPFPASGFLGVNSINSEFSTEVTYTKSGTNPKGEVTVTITTCNRPDGSVVPGCSKSTPELLRKYFIKSNAISELALISGGSASFGSKTNVSEILANGNKVSLDGGNTMQLVFTPNGSPFPAGMSANGSTCQNSSGCASIVIFRSSGLGGGVWYSSAWGQVGSSAPKTYLKNVASGGTVSVK